jgi:cellulose biosynthesis protein BcsQ
VSCYYVEKIFGPDGQKSAKFTTTISRAVVIPKAQKVGKTIFQTNSTHKVTDEYRSLAREIEERLAVDEPSVSTASAHVVPVAVKEEGVGGL